MMIRLNRLVLILKNSKSKVHANLALPPLVGSIEAFLERYDESAKLMEEFVILFEKLLENEQAQECLNE